MKILFVSQALPDANGRGFEKRAAQHLACLKALGEVTMVIPAASAQRAHASGFDPATAGIARLLIRTEPTRADLSQQAYEEADNPVSRLIHGLRRRYDTDQYVLKKDRDRYRERLGRDYDLVFAFRIGAAVWASSVYGDDLPGISIVDFDDIESLALARNSAGRSHSLFWQFMIGRYIARLRQTEDRLSRSWDMVLTCSKHDAGLLEKRGYRVDVIPNAISFAKTAPPIVTEPLQILFIGTLSYRPNADGITWFVDEVWPEIYREMAGRVTLVIAGFDPPAEILALGEREGVSVAGPVDDLHPLYAASSIIVSPIFSGSGTRIKIIEAFAFERAVVTSSIGCEGLELEGGLHAEIADTPQDFARAVLRLARSPAARQQIARQGREFGLRHFSAEGTAARFRRIVTQAMEEGPQERRGPVQAAPGAVS